MKLRGIIIPGQQIAQTTVPKQKEFFIQKLPEIERIFNGSINLNIYPNHFVVENYDYYFPRINWDPSFPIENFGFIKVDKLIISQRVYITPAYLYFPNQSPHKENSQQIELLTEYIPEAKYGEEITLELADGKISLT